MGEYTAVVEWHRGGAPFIDNRYSRGHRWRFDGGVEVPASASPLVVSAPMSVAAAVDPEEAFVASLSSCHMLWFLFLAARDKFVVDSYRDTAVGTMAADAVGQEWMARVTLHPDVQFAGDRQPTPGEIGALHEEAHDRCYIARSVRSDVRCEPVVAAG